MKEQKIFRSKEGRQQILEFYKNILSKVTYDYNEIYIDTSYGKTYLLEAGLKENPSVFLFHGSCSNSAMWYGDIKILSEKFHVFSVDILGEPGNSEAKRLDVKSSDHALWINEILEKLNINKAIFMGNSLGAWMSLKYAINFPEKVDKLVLIAPSGLVNARLSYVLKSIFYALQGEKGLKKIGKLISGTDKIPEIVLTFNKLVAKNFNPIIGSLPVFSNKELACLTMPTLFLCGKNDVIVDANKAGKRLKYSLKEPYIDIIKNNGHVIYNTMEKIIPFLDGK